MSKEELGTLIIVILKARNLNDKHSFRKQDVFAKASLNGTEKRTPVDVKGGQHPVWDAEMRFSVLKATGGKHRKLEVSCYAKEPRTDDLLGTGTVDIADTLKTGEFDEWVPLSIDGVVRGDIYLEMTYYANAPAPTPSNNAGGGLTVPTSTGLNRRQSKLSPSDRLSRPTVAPTPKPVQHNSFGSASSPAYGNSPTGKHSALPNLPEERLPYGSPPINSGPVPVPTFLRPGSARPSSSPISRPHSEHLIPSASPPRHSKAYQSHGGSASPHSSQQRYDHSVPASLVPNPYLTPSASPAPSSFTPVAQHGYDTRLTSTPTPVSQQNPYMSPITTHAHSFAGYNPPAQQGPLIFRTPSPAVPVSHTPVPSGPPPLWAATTTSERPSGGFAFPMPMMSPAQDVNPYPTSFGTPAPSQHRPDPNVRADAHLQVRYQTPLPLPPVKTPSPPRDPPAPVQPVQQIPAKVELKVDTSRIDALKRAEAEAARRRAQEIKDLELALQLDQELNK